MTAHYRTRPGCPYPPKLRPGPAGISGGDRDTPMQTQAAASEFMGSFVFLFFVFFLRIVKSRVKTAAGFSHELRFYAPDLAWKGAALGSSFVSLYPSEAPWMRRRGRQMNLDTE